MNTPANGPGRPTRRQFGKGLARLAAAPLAAAGAAAQKADAPAATPAEALAEVVRARHGKHLSEGQLKAVRRSIARNQAAAARLRNLKLANGDEPAFTFRADLP